MTQGTKKTTIADLKPGDYFKGTVKILRANNPGPLFLTITDGFGNIEAIGRDGLFKKNNLENIIQKGNFGTIQIKDSRKKGGQKKKENKPKPLSADSLEEGMVIYIEGKGKIHRGELEIKLSKVKRSEKDFDSILDNQAYPTKTTFSIESERYESMKERFIEVAQRIRKAIMVEQPIQIRHHNDADGICAGLAMEQAIENLMERSNIEVKNKLYRKPNISPFYDEKDLFRDVSKFNRYSKKFGDKSPLIVFLDTASTPENAFALETLQAFGFDAVVVDHHNPGDLKNGKSEICDFVDLHLNPYLFGWDSETCGGMLSYELAKMVDETFHRPIYPAVAAIGDRSDIEEVDKYINNALKDHKFLKDSQNPKEQLLRMAKIIDFMSHSLRLDAGGGAYRKVFTDRKVVNVVGRQVDALFQQTLDSLLPNLEPQIINGICFTEIDLEKYTQRGKYPTSGKVLGIAHDYVKTHQDMGKGREPEQPAFTLGYFDNGIIIRATHPILPVPSLLEDLQEKMPNAGIDGGGHEVAGSIKFNGTYLEKVRKFIKQKLSSINLP